MAPFDKTKAYAEKEEVFFDDGREVELLHFVYGRPDIDDIRGSPARVLAAIDEFARTRYLMNVGEDKGRIVTDLIAEVKPKIMVSRRKRSRCCKSDRPTGRARRLRRLLLHPLRRCCAQSRRKALLQP